MHHIFLNLNQILDTLSQKLQDFTADSEFIGWHGICAGCMLNGVES
jgi:hypothetical protein